MRKGTYDMTIRNAAKALILHNGKLLLIKYHNSAGEVCYTIPGGGQNCLETMEEAVIRECLEETGYHVHVGKFAGLYEEIIENKAYQEKYPAYAHKIFHIFLCSLLSDVFQEASELDDRQIGHEWVDLSKAGDINLYPLNIREGIQEMISGEGPVFLGIRKMPLPK